MKQLLEEKRQQVQALNEELENLLTIESPELMTEEMIKRDYKKQELTKMYNHLKDEIAEYDRMKRQVQLLKSELTHQNKKLEAQKWDALHSRKMLTNNQ